MLLNLPFQFFFAREHFSTVQNLSAFAVRSFYLPVFPWRIGPYSSHLHPQTFCNPLKLPYFLRSLLIIDKLCSVVHLNDMNPETPLFLQTFKKISRFVAILLIYNLQDAFSTIFVDCDNLIVLLSIAGNLSFYLINSKIKNYSSLYEIFYPDLHNSNLLFILNLF